VKIFIAGQKTFGSEVLKAVLHAGHNVVGVSAAPQIKYYDKLKSTAISYGIPVINDAEKLSHYDIPAGTDLIISAHSHWFISDRCIASCKYGGIGFHPSLLPRHRGRDAVRWASAMGDPITGATVYWLDGEVDGGDILLQKPVFNKPGWDYHKLWKEIFPVGVRLVVEAVGLIAQHKAPRIKQDERFKTWEPPFNSAKLPRGDLFQIGGGSCG